MAEQVRPAQAVEVAWFCEADVETDGVVTGGCGKAMTFTGAMLPVHPPTYEHRCPDGHKRNLSRTYPRCEVRPLPRMDVSNEIHTREETEALARERGIIE